MAQKGMLGTLPLSKILGPVSSLVEAIASERGEEVLEELKRFNRREPCWGPKPADSDFLILAGEYPAVKLTKNHYPREFYQKRTGLVVYSGFDDQIVAVAEPSNAGKKFQKAPYWELKKHATGRMLLQSHTDDVWSATDFCAWLSIMLAKQSKGQDGSLLNNGKANLFLVKGSDYKVFVVHVDWYSDDRKWYVDAWYLDDVWRAGRRFFSTDSL